MTERITTLERLKDLQPLLASDADTILVSLDGLSSSAAHKLSREELESAAAAAQTHNKNISVRANLTLHEDETDKADDMMKYLASQRVHSIFYADPALFLLAKKYNMTARMIYDPETLMTSVKDAEWWLNRNIGGVAVSPLLTLQETTEITQAVKKAVVTVHGRTLMSRSFRKLLSAYEAHYGMEYALEGREGLTLIEAKRDGIMPVYEDETGTLIYSDNVLDSFDFIDRIMQSGPLGILVEGSMISFDEQLTAVRAYRRIMDGEASAAVGKEYREAFRAEPLDSGYYEQKTVR